jgi:DNA-binding NarL/FixJ family response regulator
VVVEPPKPANAQLEGGHVMLVESCKILIAGNCIFQRGVASIIRDVVPSALIAGAFCFADARLRLNHGEFFAAIFDIDADRLNEPISFRTLRVDCPHLILGVLSRSANANEILNYLAAGVTGYILERSGQTEVERGIREILNGALYVPPSVIEPAARKPDIEQPARGRNCSRLTPRQDEVLRLLRKGCSNKEIARQLNLSPHTVKNHVSALLRCFAVQKRDSLVMAAATPCAEETGHSTRRGASQMRQMSA